MSNDFQKKEPSKTEKMMYQLAMSQQSIERGLWSTSTVVMALALLSKAKPEDIAELLVNGDEKIKEFSNQVNDVVKKLESDKKGSEKAETEPVHDHSDPNHTH